MDIRGVVIFLAIIIIVMMISNQLIHATNMIKNKEVSYIVSLYIAFVVANYYEMYQNNYIGSVADQIKISMKSSIRPVVIVGLVRYLSDFVIPKQTINVKYIIAVILGYFIDSYVDKM